MNGPFSHRYGYGARQEIRVREDAPEALRAGLVSIGQEFGLTYSNMREVVCRALHCFPDPSNWSEVPNIRDEVTELLRTSDWYRVYDAAEGLYRYLSQRGRGEEFEQRLNALFIRRALAGRW